MSALAAQRSALPNRRGAASAALRAALLGGKATAQSLQLRWASLSTSALGSASLESPLQSAPGIAPATAAEDRASGSARAGKRARVAATPADDAHTPAAVRPRPATPATDVVRTRGAPGGGGARAASPGDSRASRQASEARRRQEGQGFASARKSLGQAMEAAWRRGGGRVISAGLGGFRDGAGNGPATGHSAATRQPSVSLPAGPQSRRAMAAAAASREGARRTALATAALAPAPVRGPTAAAWPRSASVVSVARPSSSTGRRALRCLEAVSAGPGGEARLQAALDRLAQQGPGSSGAGPPRVNELSFRARLACKWLVSSDALQRSAKLQSPHGSSTSESRAATDDRIVAELQAAHARLAAQLTRAGIMQEVRAWANAPHAAASSTLPW